MFNFWSTRQPASKKEPAHTGHGTSHAPPSEQSDVEPAHETLANVLRIFGRHAFDVDNREAAAISHDFEGWARHVLLGTPPNTDDPAVDSSETPGRRWGELCRFVNRHRQGEKGYVQKNIQNLRDFIWTFIHHVGEAFIQDQDSDQHLKEHLHKLKQAATGQSLEQIKQEVLSAVDGLQQVMTDRSERQKRHMQTLGEKIQAVERELGTAKKQMALDPLTQLYNRTALDTQIERVSTLNVIAGSPACFLMIDIDHFKQVNDTYGHQAGDEVIRQVANRTVLTFPRKTDFVARYGGEEFAVILQGESAETARTMAEQLWEKIRDTPVTFQGKDIPITVSLGLAEIRTGETPAQWIARADQALYQAKEQGRDRVILDAPKVSSPHPQEK